MMMARLEACQRLLSSYDSVGNDFLYSIVTGDGSWMRHYDPELKSQSPEDRHPPFPRKKTIEDSLFRRETPARSLLGPQPLFTSITWSKGTIMDLGSLVKTLKKLKNE
jgi:hypothetical protein